MTEFDWVNFKKGGTIVSRQSMLDFKGSPIAISTTSKRPPKKVIQSWIDDVINVGRGLTKWENEFIADIDQQFRESGSLSPKQEEILERIYANKT